MILGKAMLLKADSPLGIPGQVQDWSLTRETLNEKAFWYATLSFQCYDEWATSSWYEEACQDLRKTAVQQGLFKTVGYNGPHKSVEVTPTGDTHHQRLNIIPGGMNMQMKLSKKNTREQK